MDKMDMDARVTAARERLHANRRFFLPNGSILPHHHHHRHHVSGPFCMTFTFVDNSTRSALPHHLFLLAPPETTTKSHPFTVPAPPPTTEPAAPRTPLRWDDTFCRSRTPALSISSVIKPPHHAKPRAKRSSQPAFANPDRTKLDTVLFNPSESQSQSQSQSLASTSVSTTTAPCCQTPSRPPLLRAKRTVQRPKAAANATLSVSPEAVHARSQQSSIATQAQTSHARPRTGSLTPLPTISSDDAVAIARAQAPSPSHAPAAALTKEARSPAPSPIPESDVSATTLAHPASGGLPTCPQSTLLSKAVVSGNSQPAAIDDLGALPAAIPSCSGVQQPPSSPNHATGNIPSPRFICRPLPGQLKASALPAIPSLPSQGHQQSSNSASPRSPLPPPAASQGSHHTPSSPLSPIKALVQSPGSAAIPFPKLLPTPSLFPTSLSSPIRPHHSSPPAGADGDTPHVPGAPSPSVAAQARASENKKRARMSQEMSQPAQSHRESKRARIEQGVAQSDSTHVVRASFDCTPTQSAALSTPATVSVSVPINSASPPPLQPASNRVTPSAPPLSFIDTLGQPDNAGQTPARFAGMICAPPTAQPITPRAAPVLGASTGTPTPSFLGNTTPSWLSGIVPGSSPAGVSTGASPSFLSIGSMTATETPGAAQTPRATPSGGMSAIAALLAKEVSEYSGLGGAKGGMSGRRSRSRAG